MAESIKCVHCGNNREQNLNYKCPSCGSKVYPLGGGYLYPKEGLTFVFMIIAIGIVAIIACGLAIYYLQIFLLSRG